MPHATFITFFSIPVHLNIVNSIIHFPLTHSNFFNASIPTFSFLWSLVKTCFILTSNRLTTIIFHAKICFHVMLFLFRKCILFCSLFLLLVTQYVIAFLRACPLAVTAANIQQSARDISFVFITDRIKQTCVTRQPTIISIVVINASIASIASPYTIMECQSHKSTH